MKCYYAQTVREGTRGTLQQLGGKLDVLKEILDLVK